MSVHQIFLVGRATKDAEILTTKNDKQFAKFSLAINEFNQSTKEEKSFFYDIIIFNKNIEKVAESIRKGDSILVYGRPDIDVYISKKDNQPKASVTVVAETWRVLK